MKVHLLATLALVSLSLSLEDTTRDMEEWENYKIANAKFYPSEEEENKRKRIFLDNLKAIREHNERFERGETTYTLGINEFTDMTSEEISVTMKGLKLQENPIAGKIILMPRSQLPDTKDWRKEGAVTPVKSQGTKCRSCWAFGAVGALEGQVFMKTKQLVSLSEQNIVDCARKEGHEGCGGGDPRAAFNYIKTNGGIDTEESYPYKGVDQECKYDPARKAATDSGFVSLPAGDENDLKAAVALYGPVSVCIDSNHTSFHNYRGKGGVYYNPNCSSERLDHVVLVVGYGTAQDGQDYWLVKNSWGKTWGLHGYIKMARNRNNHCGIATRATYPIVP